MKYGILFMVTFFAPPQLGHGGIKMAITIIAVLFIYFTCLFSFLVSTMWNSGKELHRIANALEELCDVVEEKKRKKK